VSAERVVARADAAKHLGRREGVGDIRHRTNLSGRPARGKVRFVSTRTSTSPNAHRRSLHWSVGRGAFGQQNR
jgi:hypothetical protein